MAFPGSSDNAAGSGASTGATSSGNVTSGTASEAMIRAATAASSAEAAQAGAQAATPVTAPAVTAGDTPKLPAVADSGTTEGASGPVVPAGSAAPAAANADGIPENRIQAAVRNARAEVETQYAWAREVPETARPFVAIGVNLVQRLQRDSLSFYHQLGDDLRKRGMLQGDGAPATGQPGAAAATGGFKLPKASLRSEDGSGAYSEDQMGEIVSNLTNHILQQVRGEMRPALEFQQTEQEAREEETARQQTIRARDSVMAEARKLPHFTKENEPKIQAILMAMSPEQRRLLGPPGALYHAYNTFLTTQVFPSIDTAAEERIRAANKKKAATSLGQVDPTSGTGDAKAPAIRDGDVGGLARRMEQMAQAGIGS